MNYQVFPTFPGFRDPAQKRSDTGFSPALMPDCDPPRNHLWCHPGLPEPAILDWPFEGCDSSSRVDDVGFLGEEGWPTPEGAACFLSVNHLLHDPLQDGCVLGIGAWAEFVLDFETIYFDDFMLFEPMAFEETEGTATETAADPSCSSTAAGALLAQTVAQQTLEHAHLRQQEHIPTTQESGMSQYWRILAENDLQDIQNAGYRAILPASKHQDHLNIDSLTRSSTPQQTHGPLNDSNASHYTSSVISTASDMTSSTHTAHTTQTVYEYRMEDPSQPQ